ncbi:hypothetical protein [Paracoccus sp. (in: a-proteobacteria)]|uniref:hypothetical protein n=1 Tax=Paracoccus sp. TaxID=267 RepID=UPI0028A82DB1|nr:hypothetical protein [Paracoccus sp. (in: a-proteobacteria)]
MMDMGTAAIRLASELAEFERKTGKTMIVSEARAANAFEELEAAIAEGKAQERRCASKSATERDLASESDVSAPEAPKSEVEPVAPPETAVRASAKRDRPAAWDALTHAEKRVVEHIEGRPSLLFSAEDDLHLVEMLADGSKLPVVAEFLQVSETCALDRWKEFMHPDVLGVNGKPSINGQNRLLTALRYIKEHG